MIINNIYKNQILKTYLLGILIILVIFLSRVLAYHSDSLSKIITLIAICISIILVMTKRKEYILFIFLLFLEYDAAVSPHNIAFIILLFLLIIEFFFKFINNKSVTLNKIEIIIILLITYYSLLGIYGYINFEFSSELYMKFFIDDLKKVLVFLLTYMLFKNINFKNINFTLFISLISYLLFNLYGYVFDMKPVFLGGNYIGYTAQLNFLLLYTVGQLFFKNYILYFILLISTILLMVLTEHVISQNILALFISILLFLIISKRILFASFIFIFLLLGILLLNLDISHNILVKFNNLYTIVDFTNIYEISKSPLVRIIEFNNIINNMDSWRIFGYGLGGNFTDTFMSFPKLDKYDFSDMEIRNSVFFAPHNINLGLLKYGLIYVFFSIYLFVKVLQIYYKSSKNEDKKIAFIYMSLLIFAILNIGFTNYPSIFYGMVLAYAKK